MTIFITMAFFITSLALAILMYRLFGSVPHPMYRPPGYGWAALAYIIPALFFLSWVILAPTEATRFRMALRGFAFRADTERTITVGSNYKDNDIWISNLHLIPKVADQDQDDAAITNAATVGSLKFRPGSGGQTGNLYLLNPDTKAATWRSVGLLMQAPAIDSYNSPLTIALQDGDTLGFAGNNWQINLNYGWFNLFNCPPNTYLTHLNQPGTRLSLTLPRICGADSVAKSTYVLNPVFGIEPSPLAGLMYRGNNQYRHSSVFLTALNPDITLFRNGQSIPIPTEPLLLPSETRLHVLAFPLAQDNKFISGGLRDKRSFVAKTGKQNLLLELDTPERYTLAWQDLKELVIKPPPQAATDSKGTEPLRVGLSMGKWSVTDEQSLHLRNVSHKIGAESFAIINLPQSWTTDATHFMDWPAAEPLTVAFSGGRSQVKRGQPFWLGEQNLAALQLDLLTPSWGLVIFTLLLAIVKARIAFLTKASAAHLVVAAMIELLVIFRVILGYRLWIMPPLREEPMQLALIAWALLPWSFLFASLSTPASLANNLPDAPKRKEGMLLASIGMLFSVVWCVQISGSVWRAIPWVLLHIIAMLVPLIFSYRHHILAMFASISQRLVASMGGILPKFIPYPQEFLWWPMLILLTRVILYYWLGIKERIFIGSLGLSLTLLHIPLAILLEAYYLEYSWRRFIANNGFTGLDALMLCYIALFTWFIPSYIASDFGLLLNLLILLGVVIIVLVAAYPKLTWYQWLPYIAVPSALIAIPLGIINLGYIPESWGYSRDYLRILQFANPDYVMQVGATSSEELTIMSSAIRSYTENNFWGKGYALSELSTHIPAGGAMSDYVTAVFIAAEWGRIGVIGLFLLYTMGVITSWYMFIWHPKQQSALNRYRSVTLDRAGAIAGLALITFCVPSLYMIMANHNWWVFTGKNVYLLGLNSGSDIFESFILLLLFASSATVIRDKVAGYA